MFDIEIKVKSIKQKLEKLASLIITNLIATPPSE